ncbi:unnamed protein product [Nezara viridula]|uniref:Uncharacterized protein n=1 Tax=Nezara viridula TaxID=85310 RepID=A0A9P0HD87_NEZVI|nr:unnamed protein product [Nezara viridula]
MIAHAPSSTLAQRCGRKGKGLDNHGRTYSVLSRGNTQVVRAIDSRRLKQTAPAPATISNSSLQDAGVEYSGAELASYMGQLNNSR